VTGRRSQTRAQAWDRSRPDRTPPNWVDTNFCSLHGQPRHHVPPRIGASAEDLVVGTSATSGSNSAQWSRDRGRRASLRTATFDSPSSAKVLVCRRAGPLRRSCDSDQRRFQPVLGRQALRRCWPPLMCSWSTRQPTCATWWCVKAVDVRGPRTPSCARRTPRAPAAVRCARQRWIVVEPENPMPLGRRHRRLSGRSGAASGDGRGCPGMMWWPTTTC